MKFYIKSPLEIDPDILKKGTNETDFDFIAWNETSKKEITFKASIQAGQDLVRLLRNGKQVTEFEFKRSINVENTKVSMKLKFEVLKKVTQPTAVGFKLEGKNDESNSYSRNKTLDVSP